MNRGQVFVATSAYGASRVRSTGQAAYVAVVEKSGADGIEIRRELFAEQESVGWELEAVYDQIRQTHLNCAYSVPFAIWQPDGRLNQAAMRQAVSEAVALGAWNVKFALGSYKQDTAELVKLQELLTEIQDQAPDLQVMLENDQTQEGGRVAQLLKFLEDCNMHRLPIGLTFDIGNWLWTGEQVTQAAEQLAPYVAYIHTKHAALHNGKWVALPLAEELEADWRRIVSLLPKDVPRTIEFPLIGADVTEVTRHFVELLRESAIEHAE